MEAGRLSGQEIGEERVAPPAGRWSPL